MPSPTSKRGLKRHSTLGYGGLNSKTSFKQTRKTSFNRRPIPKINKYASTMSVQTKSTSISSLPLPGSKTTYQKIWKNTYSTAKTLINMTTYSIYLIWWICSRFIWIFLVIYKTQL